MDIKAFRGLSGTYNVRANERDRGAPRNIECLVQFLNNTQHKFVLDRRSKGQDLLDSVFTHLDLIETDYFGLKYIHQESHCRQNTVAIDKSSTLLTTTQSLNSYDRCPSSNASLSSSSATNATATANHLNLTTDSSTPPNIAFNNINNNNSNINNNNIIISSNLGNSIYAKDLQHQPSSNDDNSISTLIEGRWLDPTKTIQKQYKTGPPFKFYFRVKFYVSDPTKLAYDATRKHLYLQLRQDILNNRLIVPTCSAILLASYILQSEVGDFKRELLEEDYASNFNLLPNQSEDIKEKVIELHKQHKSLSSADAEYQFLEHAAKKLDCYGVEFYEAKNLSKNDVQIGVSSNGIVVFKDYAKISQFSWAKIIKIMFKKKIFSIQLRRCEGENCDNFIEFNLLTNLACKSFWEECVAQHSFFRLHQPKSPPRKLFSFLNFSSKFQYNGKTEYQTMEESRKRSFSHFSRTPSKRYARRTIPTGMVRPSWSDSAGTEGKNPDEAEEHTDNHDYAYCSTDKTAVRDSPRLSNEPVASGSVNIKELPVTQSNGTPNQRSSAYRPQSLTLKSFMYIDESRNNTTQDDLYGTTGKHDGTNEICDVKRNCNPDSRRCDVFKMDLRRSESLRLSDSIRGAFSLTKKAGATSSSQFARLISDSFKDKFRKSKGRKVPKTIIENVLENQRETDGLELVSKTVRLSPGKDGKYGFKIREFIIKKMDSQSSGTDQKRIKESSIIIHDISNNSPAATCSPPLYEGDKLISVNGTMISGLSESKVESLIKSIQLQKPPELVLEVRSKFTSVGVSANSSGSVSEVNSRLSPTSTSSNSGQKLTLVDSIEEIRKGLDSEALIEAFEKLSRKKEDESLEESKLMENIDKNRYRDILPYDSTRVQLIDSMTGDYINASFVDMAVPSGTINRYIATQGPLESTCDDFWQMVWEQSCYLIIMVTPLIEAGRVKCHKYWPEEREEMRYGQLSIRNINEKAKTATIKRKIQLMDVKSGEKRIVSQIQYKAWPDHEVPEDCSDFLKLVSRVRKHRASSPKDPIVVHCSAGIGRTGVLILMETAICIMEYGKPIDPVKILEDMRRQRAMLIQTSSQFKFVCSAICKVYHHKLYKRTVKVKKI